MDLNFIVSEFLHTVQKRGSNKAALLRVRDALSIDDRHQAEQNIIMFIFRLQRIVFGTLHAIQKTEQI
jgi:hypothetical protein